MAYILGKEDFFGFEFKVNPDVLIPRKETELIVEKALEVIEKDALRCVLDLCCGCGNISISLKKIFDDKINVFASDISLEALRVARRNAELHKADIKIINADLFSGLRWKFFDLIVSNPPYVENKYIKDSLKYEPRIALQANNNGLYYIEKILKEGHDYLKKDGYLIMEIGYNHKDYVSGLLKKLGIYEIIEWIKDYDGNWRGIVLKVPNYK
jgi:release factor glutamine methyltransferase